MPKKDRFGYLGIMVCEKHGSPPFSEKTFFRRLCLLGKNEGLQVYVFFPRSVRWAAKQVEGYTFQTTSNQWAKKLWPLPNYVYDRCFYGDKNLYEKYQVHINKLKQNHSIQFLGQGLKGKWAVMQILAREPQLIPHLPLTEAYQGNEHVHRFLAKYEQAILKPQSGSQGKRIVHISLQGNETYILHGRDRRNQPFRQTLTGRHNFNRWLVQYTGASKYLIQAYLTLTASTGEAYDIRSLMQKNKQGQWELTGIALRRGKPGSLTSNLHGGGHAERAEPFLRSEFGNLRAKNILAKVQDLSMKIPSVLEASHGRLLELGIDLGIDKQGNVWVLEVNSKPGRTVFSQINDPTAKQSSVSNPIHYARYLMERQLGG